MALSPNHKKPNLDEIIQAKTQQSFNLQPIKEEETIIKDEKLIQIMTRIPKWVLDKQNQKYRRKGISTASWIRMLIMEDLDK